MGGDANARGLAGCLRDTRQVEELGSGVPLALEDKERA